MTYFKEGLVNCPPQEQEMARIFSLRSSTYHLAVIVLSCRCFVTGVLWSFCRKLTQIPPRTMQRRRWEFLWSTGMYHHTTKLHKKKRFKNKQNLFSLTTPPKPALKNKFWNKWRFYSTFCPSSSWAPRLHLPVKSWPSFSPIALLTALMWVHPLWTVASAWNISFYTSMANMYFLLHHHRWHCFENSHNQISTKVIPGISFVKMTRYNKDWHNINVYNK